MHEKKSTKDYGPEIEQALKLLVVLSRASRSLMEVSQQDIKRYGLNLSEFAVLELLYHKGPTPIQQIGSKVLLASGTMTYVVDKLVSKDYIIRKQSEQDRRVIMIELTPAGEEVIARIFPEHAQTLHDRMSHLSNEQQQQLIQLLKILGQPDTAPSN
ncbi:MarR family winged helix-turn-helix transcriptional regulator [Paenibacillus assamensis]|uniref:MarR family winged helix-turn-helix transcriptional regulator n=1 Tax=Paenibacillus assamensis TaxID=311244 RepID=UPI0004118FCB|nr:MarR family transcriptional regulator [Paenibacillus assamensis]